MKTIVLTTLMLCLVPISGCQVEREEQENCTDGLDNDGDGQIDCNDSDCSGYTGCFPSCPNYPNCTPENCVDGLDNDGDGRTDCYDPDCYGQPACSPSCTPTTEDCNDGRDNDCDGRIDCNDPECHGTPACCTSYEICGDGLDNDCNGRTDCDDSECFDMEECWCAFANIELNNGGEIDIITTGGYEWGMSVSQGWNSTLALVPQDGAAYVWVYTNAIQVNAYQGTMQACHPSVDYPCDFSYDCLTINTYQWTRPEWDPDNANLILRCW